MEPGKGPWTQVIFKRAIMDFNRNFGRIEVKTSLMALLSYHVLLALPKLCLKNDQGAPVLKGGGWGLS